MRALLLATALIAAPAAAQDHDAHAGHAMPSASETQTEPTHGTHSGHTPMEQDQVDHSVLDHGEIDHSAMDHSSMDHSGMGHGKAPSPPPASDPPPRAFEGPEHAADMIFGAETMAPVREAVARENGKFTGGTIMLERFETRIANGDDHYLWDAQGWYGGDIDKLWLKSEGEGACGGSVESAEIQALWSHAIGPWFDVQAGARYDFEPAGRSYAVIGVQGLAPYMFEVDAAAFLSDAGDVTARIEAEYDQRITQRLILQPRAEVNLSAQDVADRELGSGLTSIEAGLRLRYEFAREFAPYIGVEYEAKLGETADIARAKGEDPDSVSLLIGLRTWF